MPYYDRDSLAITLSSFDILYGGRDDFEVVIIEESKNVNDPEKHEKLLNIIKNRNNIIHIEHMGPPIYNPAPLFNLGASKAQGSYFILTNPECYHFKNILKGFDEELSNSENNYVICACRNARYQDGMFYPDQWYQHSVEINRKLHFCSCISRENFFKLDGFDNEYAKGLAYDDNDFIQKVLHNKDIHIIVRDDLLVFHIHHERTYLDQNQDLIKINLSYYKQKWGL